ncbi:MAG: hypothetical protein N2422_06415 [Rhodobacteraceae bacterium]|nr:hypothetical protein [Paracoccaceae bacterium]
MGLDVIGSGFGRTGTRSLKEALETLGFGPCHHMEEVFANPAQVPLWASAVAGGAVDWSRLYAGYRSQVDWPGAHFWREAAEAFPEAKVVHSVRPDDSWWSSFSVTIGKLLKHYRSIPLPPHVREMLDAMDDAVGVQTFAGRYHDRDDALAASHRRTAEVRAAIAPERLLVFDVAEGWEPLCAFLGVPVPDAPFPHRNDRTEFWANLGGEPD